MLTVKKLCVEIMHWEQYDMAPTLGARIEKYPYEVNLKPNFIGELLIPTPQFYYNKGDVEGFAISFLSPPGNKYRARINLHCTTITDYKFTVHTREFEIRFFKKGGRRGTLILVE